MTRILIGYDGSANADAALDDLRLAGLPSDAEARTLTVGDYATAPLVLEHGFAVNGPAGRAAAAPSIALARASSAASEAKGLAARAAVRVQSYYPDWWVRPQAVGGAPSHELLRMADEWGADLVVVGTTRRSLLSRLFLGSVSRTVAADASCSVRVARRRARPDGGAPPRILVGVDGSWEAESAVRAVGERRWPEGTMARLLAVDDEASPRRLARVLPSAAAMVTRENREVAERAREMAMWARGELRSVGLDVSAAFSSGPARDILVEEAGEWGADSIFVGSGSFGGALERFQIASVVIGVAMDAPCSVEVVRSRAGVHVAGAAIADTKDRDRGRSPECERRPEFYTPGVRDPSSIARARPVGEGGASAPPSIRVAFR